MSETAPALETGQAAPPPPDRTGQILNRAPAPTSLDSVFRVLVLVIRRARRWVRHNEPMLTTLLETWTRYHALDRSGWLPHPTTPFHLLDPAQTDPAVASRVLATYYETEWNAVEAAFRLRLDAHGFDPETLATFDEALLAHRHKLYRATTRTLFPDIERKAREMLETHGVTGHASLLHLRQAVDTLGLDNFSRAGVISPKLYRLFARHLYANVKTRERLAEIAADPVPNRHAALHGLVVYATAQTSLNALIMAEYAHLSILAVDRALAQRALEAQIEPSAFDPIP